MENHFWHDGPILYTWLYMVLKMITHIYFGTAGAAGLYTKAIKQAINDDEKHDFIVNYYYPGDDAQRLFFKHTELSGPNRLRNFKYLRFFVRYVELIVGLCKSYIRLKKAKSKVLNYNLISQHAIELFFLYLCKKRLNINIILTLHDVVPFKSSYVNIINQLTVKKKIIKLADGIILHNKSSLDSLCALFKYDAKIYLHSFPLMNPDLSLAFAECPIAQFDTGTIFTFIFVGHPREEKGLDILCSAWEIFIDLQKGARLIIASNIGEDSEIYRRLMVLEGVEIIGKFIPDSDYFNLIRRSDCVVLPYRMGTNSGIPGTVALLRTAMITSNIPMFYENDLVPRESLFESGSPDSLALKMHQIFSEGADKFSINTESISKYMESFDLEVSDVYGDISKDFIGI